MSTSKYITLQNNRLALQDLIDQITYVIDQGLVTLKVKESIEFTEVLNSTLGGLRYNTTNNAIEYSNDGITWNLLHSDTFWWDSSKAYSTGTVVLYNTGWYAASSFTTKDDIPGISSKWILLTPGTIFKYVSNSAQLVQAIATQAADVCIYLKGSFTGSNVATIHATNVTIWSDESSSFSGDIKLTVPSYSNIYWHSNGTRISGDYTIDITGGALWIDRLTVAVGAVLKINNHNSVVNYRRIDGIHEGGSFKDWISTVTEDTDDFIHKDLTILHNLQYSDRLKLYVQDGNSYGYMIMDDIAAKIASQASAYFKIDLSGPANIKPSSANKGYVFYATDTGALYVMGDNNKWNDPLILRGADGKQGRAGATAVPKISSTKELSWELQTLAEGAYPKLPSPISLQGTPGKSALDIWKEYMGTPDSTEEDFLNAIGAGSRRIPFTKLDVASDYVVTFRSKYPLMAIQDNVNSQWLLDKGSITYSGNNDIATVNIKSILEAKGLLTDKAFIRTTYGTHYRNTSIDVKASYGWIRTDGEDEYMLYTGSAFPAEGDLAYTEDTLTGDSLAVYSYISGIKGGISTELGHFSRHEEGDTGIKYCWIGADESLIYTIEEKPEKGKVAYTKSTLETSSAINITEGFQEEVLSSIDTALGTYLRQDDDDTAQAIGWSSSSSVGSLWTATDTPKKGDRAYTSNTLTGTNSQLLTDYQPAAPSAEISGTWYALFSGGGGSDGKSATIEIVHTETTAPGTKATLYDIAEPYFIKDSVIYKRSSSNDTASAVAWESEVGKLFYTDSSDISVYNTVLYEDKELTITAGYPDKVGEASTSTDRKYILSVPAGPEGRYYAVPTNYDLNQTYYPVTADKNYYDTVIHQGSTWVYVANVASKGTPPPELPDTANDYWRLLAAAGEAGKDIGDGIYVHSMTFKKPFSEHPLHLQVMRSTSADINNAAMFIDTSVNDLGKNRVKAWNTVSSKWTEIPAEGMGAEYNNQIVAVDMFDTNIEVFIFYRWITVLNKNTKWQATTFPNSTTIDVTEDSNGEDNVVVVKHYIDITYDMLTDDSMLVIKPYKFILGIVDHNGVVYEVDESYVVYDFATDSTTIDLSYVFAQANIDKLTGTWKLIVLDGDQQVGGVVDNYGHTHLNKDILDNFDVDSEGNITLYGVVIVSASQRTDSKYLVDTESFEDTDPLLEAGAYTSDLNCIDPQEYSAIKVK